MTTVLKIRYYKYRIKTQEICDIVVSLFLFLIVYCSDKYIIQKMCDEAVDDSLTASKLIPIGLLQVK